MTGQSECSGPLRLWETRLWALLVPGILVLHLIVLPTGGAESRLSGVDQQFYYATLRSVVFDRDLDFTNELTRLTPHPEQLDVRVVEATGRAANKYPPGWAVVGAVLYVPLMIVDPAQAADGYEPRYQLAAGLAQALAAALGLLLTYRLARRWIRPGPALGSCTFVLIGSPLLFYSVYEVYMAHAAGFFAVTAWTWQTLRLANGKEVRWRDWALLGIAGSLMMTVRYSNAAFLPLLAYPLHSLWPDSGKVWKGLTVAALAATPLLLGQALYLDRVFGSPIAYSYSGQDFRWTRPVLASGLFSHRHGLFFFAPVLLLAVGGFLIGFRRLPRGFRAAAVASLLALLWINTAWETWWFGHAFGARAWVEASALFVLGLGFLLSTRRRSLRFAAAGGSLLASAWTVTLLLLQWADLVADDGSTTLREIVDLLIRG